MEELENVRRIASGGFGTVYRATYATHGDVAVKKLKADDSNATKSRQRFVREVQMLQQLDHDHIVNILYAELETEEPHFVMPLAESSLREELASGVPEDPEQIYTALFSPILEAIEYAHGKDIAHRDLKPENILLIDGVWQVSDFGLGKVLSSPERSITSTNATGGTRVYAAPECWSDFKNADRRADIFSLGVMLCELLRGGPCIGPQLHHEIDQLPATFRDIVDACTKRDPAHRYDSIGTFRERIEIVLHPPDTRDSTAVRPNEMMDLVNSRTLGEGEFHKLLYGIRQARDEVVRQVVVNMGRALIEECWKQQESEFRELFEEFLDSIQGERLNFEFVDEIADFVERLLMVTNDRQLFETAIEALVKVGHRHNRWHAGHTAISILESSPDKFEVAASEVLRRNPTITEWLHKFFDQRDVNKEAIAPIVRSEFDNAEERKSERN